MLKTLTAALIAASLLIAPGLTASADAAQRSGQAGAIVTIKPVKMVKKHKRHVVKHHDRRKHVKHGRQFKKHGLNARHGKFVKSHNRVIVTKRVHAR